MILDGQGRPIASKYSALDNVELLQAAQAEVLGLVSDAALIMPGFDLLMVAGHIQRSMLEGYPDINGSGERLLEMAREYFRKSNAPAVLEILARGVHSEHDQPEEIAMFGEIPVPIGTLGAGPITSSFRDSIQKAIDDVVPADKTAAIVGVANNNGVTLGLAVRTADGWQLHASIDRDWAGDVAGEVAIMKTW